MENHIFGKMAKELEKIYTNLLQKRDRYG